MSATISGFPAIEQTARQPGLGVAGQRPPSAVPPSTVCRPLDPEDCVAIRRPIIAVVWEMLTPGQPDHFVGATTACAATRSRRRLNRPGSQQIVTSRYSRVGYPASAHSPIKGSLCPRLG